MIGGTTAVTRGAESGIPLPKHHQPRFPSVSIPPGTPHQIGFGKNVNEAEKKVVQAVQETVKEDRVQ